MGGGDKGLLTLAGRPMLAHVHDLFAPQVSVLALNVNGDPERFAGFDLPILRDGEFEGQGPLAGILAALDWAADQGRDSVATVACDTPLLPGDLVARLLAARADGVPVAVAASVVDAQSVVPQPTCAVWSVELLAPLRDALRRGKRGVLSFADLAGAARATFDATVIDPFLNVNTPQDLARVDRLLTGPSR